MTRLIHTCLAMLVLAAPARAVEISLSCGVIGGQYNVCQDSVDRWERRTGHTVRIVPTPQASNDQLVFFRERLARPESGEVIDVVKIDTIWVNFVEQYLVDLSAYSEGAETQHFAALVENASFEGELKALPLWSDVGLFFYRKDLLEKHGAAVPRTWDEMETVARQIQAAERAEGNRIWGYIFDGDAGEGLTCNAMEWLATMGGAQILDAEGRVAVDDPAAMDTLRRVKGWIGDIAPPDVTTLNNESAREMFQDGGAVFMRNWPYVWALAQEDWSKVKGKVGVTTLPGGAAGSGAGTSGGWYLGVSQDSAHPEIAADLVLHMTSKNEQLQRALFSSVNPTRPELYSNPDIRNMSDFFGEIFAALQTAINRPNAELRGSYTFVSDRWSETVNAYLSGGAEDPSTLFAPLQEQLARLERRGW